MTNQRQKKEKDWWFENVLVLNESKLMCRPALTCCSKGVGEKREWPPAPGFKFGRQKRFDCKGGGGPMSPLQAVSSLFDFQEGKVGKPFGPG